MIFKARAQKGHLNMGSEYNRARFADFLKKNDGIRLKIEAEMPESSKQRGFFEGAVLPMIAFYQEDLDHRNWKDIKKVHEWVKTEFTPEIVVINNVARKIAGTTKNRLKELIEFVLDWMNDQGYQIELLNPNDYKKWKDEIYPYADIDNYIDYLVDIKKLKVR